MAIRKLIRNVLGGKLFNKLFLLYSIIIIVTFLILLFIVSARVTSIIIDQDVSFNSQVIETVDDYFNQKCRHVKNKLINLYQDAYAEGGAGKTGKDVLYMLRFYPDSMKIAADKYEDFLSRQRSVYSYIDDSSLNLAEGLNCVSVMSIASGKPYTTWRSTSNPNPYVQKYLSQSPPAGDSVKPKLYFSPAFRVDDYSRMFLIYDVIRDQSNLASKLGYLAFGYAPEFVKNAYAHYQPFLKGTILVLSPDGGVMFDSSDTYYGKAYPNFEEIHKTGNGTVYGLSDIVNVKYDDEFGFYTVGILPRTEIDRDVNSANGLILLLMLVSIATIMLLSYVSTRLFSKRVKILINGIKRIRRGDFAARTHIAGSDELAEISTNLNVMCDRLDEHIKKEYVYKLRQREAELYTLQAQVNPHFLYNSLEAIRMTALKAGNADVGRMVLLLADIFRGSIKEKIVVSIRDELNNCKSFLEFYNIRFEGKLDLVYRISDEILKFGILQHLIQPIVENVLVHGINLAREDNTVTIEGYRQEEAIVLAVRDNGRGISEERLAEIKGNLNNAHHETMGSIGIFNVNQRIKLIYGEEYGVSVLSQADAGTEVTIRIKARTIEELTQDVQGASG